ncbi:MAG: Do family serine endopeptidase [Bacteroidales bacterium]
MKEKTVFKILLVSFLFVFGSISFTQAAPSDPPSQYVDLTQAAEKSIHAVVHIKTEFMKKNAAWDDFFGGSFWQDFFGAPKNNQYPVMAAGSGVIISSDGYIVTNNHVVEEADKVTITLNNKKEYEAVIIGTDPETDLALVKIEAENLPYLSFGNSDLVKIGEWVLAVGNPFNLTSTVTAGIVSAKARNLNILGGNSGIESFIQTDAAVNQGNSGGALVNAKGELIGINSAIASGNGYYTGYSFAIPSNIAKKVTQDLKTYGRVQRAFLGVALMEIDAKKANELKLKEIKGLYVGQLANERAAQQSGLEEGDIILKINNMEVNSISELKEILTQYSPGEKISLEILRNGTVYVKKIELLNNQGKTDILTKDDFNIDKIFGAEFKEITNKEMNTYRVNGGVRVTAVNEGILKNSGIKKGFIIISVNNQPINGIDDFSKIIGHYTKPYISLEGVYDNGYYRYTYTIQMP